MRNINAKIINNEKGFSLLLSMVILFILMSFLLHTINVYESEKRFLQKERDWNTLDYMLISSVDHIIEQFDEIDDEFVEGHFHFIEGHVYYEIMDKGEYVHVTMIASLTNGRQKRVQLTYSKVVKRMINWIEGA